MRTYRFGVFLGLVIFISSLLILRSVADERYEKLQVFTKVLNLVQQYYVEPVETEKLLYGGIKGMLQELDPHTNFLPPEIFKEFESETSGEFGGLGIEISLQNEILTVISPIEDTPAYIAGIKAGDKIVEINGVTTKGISLVEAAQRMRGKKGSPVRLTIFREGFEKPQEFSINRGVVKVRSVKFTDLQNGYMYLKITSFNEKTFEDMDKSINEFEKKNGPLKGILMDMRNNPGGLLDQAVKVSDAFMDDGPIVSTRGRNEKDREVIYAKKEGTRRGFPIIVLINEYAASASEIVAGALQDSKRAVIMGQRSFGKGSVQSVVKLGDGSGLKLTVARYFTPSGRSIQAEGIVPDVPIDNLNPEAFEKAVVRKKVRREKDMERHLLSDNEKKSKAANKDDKGGKDQTEETDSVKNENFWLDDMGDKTVDEKKLSPRDLLLRKDFQVYQAFNYLKAWKTLREYKE